MVTAGGTRGRYPERRSRGRMPFSHPHENRDSGFERFAEQVGNFTTRWLFFAIMLLGACAWIWAVAAGHTHVEQAITGAFAIVTLFKISLLANSEKRELRELQERLDELGAPARSSAPRSRTR
jgi:low affinity Fe/Cu permease